MPEEVKAEKPVSAPQAAAKVAPVAVPRAKHPYRWPSITIAALFGVLYCYDVWEAVGTLVSAPDIYAQWGLAAHTPWIIFVASVLAPLLAYAAAFVLGLRRNIAVRALLLLTGLAASNALSLAANEQNYSLFIDLLGRI